mgnify:CR=1 FL=1
MKRLLLILLPIVSVDVLALPEGSEVTRGQASMERAGQSLSISQQSRRAVIEHDQFSIQAGERVSIEQPDAQSVLLNRVRAGGSMSEIYGALSANGQVFLVNPAGIVVGDQAQIDVGGLLLTTHALTDESFLSDHLQLNAHADAQRIAISGNIEVAPGSFVIVVAPSIEQTGRITAQFGQVSLVAADQASVYLNTGHWPRIEVEKASFDAWIEQTGVIDAQQGLIEISAAHASDLIDRVIYQTGQLNVASEREIVEVGGQTFIQRGEIRIAARDENSQERGYIQLEGELNADASSFNRSESNGSDRSGSNRNSSPRAGGNIDISAHAIRIGEQAQLSANGQGQGNGGTIDVIGQQLEFKAGGKISARAGEQGTKGGAVEVSGREHIQFEGQVDTRAANGQVGQLVIDPRNITISNASSSNIPPAGDPTQFQPSADDANLNIGILRSNLQNSDVTVTTDDGGVGTQSGTITLLNDIDLDGIGDTAERTLTLRANDTIELNASIADQGADPAGTVNIVMQAENDIEMSPGTRLNSGQGRIDLSTSNGDIVVSQLSSNRANNQAVSLNAGGSIFDSNGPSDNILLTGSNARLQANAGSLINSLEGRFPIISARAATLQGFEHTAAGDMRINRLVATAQSTQSLGISTSNGTISVDGLVTESEPGIKVSGSGQVSLTAAGPGKTLLLTDPVSTTASNLVLSAPNGTFSMTGNGAVTSTSGAVSITTQGDMSLGRIETGSSSDTAIELRSTSGADILDADDVGNDQLNLVASSGGLRIQRVDNFVALETQIDRLRSQDLNASQLVLNELDDLIVSSIDGASTAVNLTAGGAMTVSRISTDGTVALQGQTIRGSTLSGSGVLSHVAAPNIELQAERAIGDINADGVTVDRYFDVDGSNISLELTGETATSDANEIAVRQVSLGPTGSMRVSRLITPNETPSAKVAIASVNNGLNLRTTTVGLDETDRLSLRLNDADGQNNDQLALPKLTSVQDWSLAGLALSATSSRSRITTDESGTDQDLTGLTTNISDLLINSNQAINLNFGGNRLDLATTNGDLTVQANRALTVADINGDGSSLSTQNGNIRLAGVGTLKIDGTVFAADAVNDEIRTGLIDLSTTNGDIELGFNDLTMTSQNQVDQDLAQGLGERPSESTSIRVRRLGNDQGSGDITLGNGSARVAVTAQGGDIYMSAGEDSTSLDLNSRRLILNDNVAMQAYNLDSDPATGTVTQNDVDTVSGGGVALMISALANRAIELTSKSLGLRASSTEQQQAKDATDDIERNTDDTVLESSLENEPEQLEQTRLALMLAASAPVCDEASRAQDANGCEQQGAFREFIRSLIIGKGFPKSVRGLDE